MTDMPKSMTISSDPLEHPAMDFDLLRKEGIEHIQRMAGHIWTDYNAHDPGITILEQLCYAITDLSYRMDYDMQDILAEAGKEAYKSLFSPATLLTSNPVTLDDIRKQIIDIYGVKNAWIEIEKHPKPRIYYNPFDKSYGLTESEQAESLPLKGIYKILIEPTHTDGIDGSTILRNINELLSSKRNLCEDLSEVNILDFQDVNVIADLEIGPVDDSEQVLAEVYLRIARHISPVIQFHSLSKLLEKGKTLEEIIEGPALTHGFIDSEQLKMYQKRTVLRSSDIIQEIMDVEGVVAVRKIQLKIKNGTTAADWFLELDPGRTPRLSFRTTGEDSEISLYRNGVQVKLDLSKVKQRYDVLNGSDQPAPLPSTEKDVVLTPAKKRNIGTYFSIQEQFPPNYGIGELGLPKDADPDRKAKARQLQAYLMFFDQILANYFSQLSHTSTLFSFHNTANRTYFSQVLSEVPGAEILIKELDKDHATTLDKLTEDLKEGSGRMARILNHLMARFGEEMTDYSLILFRSATEKQLADKRKFLQDYPAISSKRGKGTNLKSIAWGGGEVSGLKMRICRLLGIEETGLKALAGSEEEGFHIVEHILLRPEKKIDPAIRFSQKDPWSLQISVVLPDWPVRFQDEGFKNLLIQTIRKECPAHIRVYIHWVAKVKMETLENQYESWINASKGVDKDVQDTAAEELMIALKQANRIVV